jgi:hypothetical protein
MKKTDLVVVALFFTLFASSQATATFEDLTLGVDTYWTGSNLAGGFRDGNAYFENQYDTSWAGFVYSDKTDIVTAGYYNQGSSISGSGYAGSNKYAVAHDAGNGNVKIRLAGNAAGKTAGGFYVNNTTDAYLSMLNGGGPVHAFDTANADYFLLSITGWHGGNPINDTINFYLADYLDSDGVEPYIVNTWQWVSLLELGNVDSLVFSTYSSQNSYDTIFGVSGSDSIIYSSSATPAYFAMDNFVTVDLPTIYDTLLYNVDTLINVLVNVVDTTGGPFTVHFISNTVPGASILVIDSTNLIWYIPEDGVVGYDTVFYTICNSQNQCDSAILIIDLLSPTGLRQVNALQTKVYPNPCGNSFSLYHTGDVKTVELFDMEGRLLRTVPCNAGELVTGIKTDDLAAGPYIVKAISDQGVGMAKVIKE